MKERLLVLILFFSLPFFTASKVYALPFFNPDLLKIKIPPGIFASPTSTLSPTSTPINTPTPESPTITPTETSIPVTPTDEVVPAISTPSGTVSPTVTPQVKQPLSQKGMIYYGVFGLLILVILFQSWPKIKKFLHDKTAEKKLP